MAEETTATREKPSLRARIEEYRPIREKIQASKLKDKPWKDWSKLQNKPEKDVRKPATELLIEEARLGRTDILTDLLNLRGLIERLNGEIENAKRHGGSIGILLLDLDGFKKLNDTFGHPKGNIYLKHVAKVFRETVRPGDVISRPGGDEFVVIIRDNGNIEQAAERLINSVKNDPEGPYHWGESKITASVGATVINIEKDPEGVKRTKEEKEKQIKEVRDKLFEQADTALYQAKNQGKDSFVVYKEGMKMPAQEYGRLRTSS